ncbi:MAG TPA: LysR family transcriptional regulator [Casimicrobiaceae bacterium]
MLNLRSVDLNLLPVFEAVYEERSLSRAAARLAMTQSAVSHALNRLRALFEDELFVRQSRGVAPTPMADQICARLRGALTAVRESVTETRGFDPATSRRDYFIAIPHPLGPLMAVELRRRLAREAPGLHVTFSTRSRPIELEQGLQDGRFDAALDWLPQAGKEFSECVAFDDGLVAMARTGHPLLRQRSLERIVQSAEFVSLRRRVEGEYTSPGLVDWERLRARIALEVSEFVEILLVVSQSDLIGPVPHSMEAMARKSFDLRPLRAFPSTPPIPVRLLWHPRRDADAAHAFMRERMCAVARAVATGREAG